MGEAAGEVSWAGGESRDDRSDMSLGVRDVNPVIRHSHLVQDRRFRPLILSSSLTISHSKWTPVGIWNRVKYSMTESYFRWLSDAIFGMLDDS